jgi:hypothetical protein
VDNYYQTKGGDGFIDYGPDIIPRAYSGTDNRNFGIAPSLKGTQLPSTIVNEIYTNVTTDPAWNLDYEHSYVDLNGLDPIKGWTTGSRTNHITIPWLVMRKAAFDINPALDTGFLIPAFGDNDFEA